MFRALFFIAIAFIVFTLGGIYSGLYPKSNIFRESWIALKQVIDKDYFNKGKVTVKERDEGQSGVLRFVPGKVQNGYTAYTIRRVPVLKLLDMNGNTVFQWDFAKLIDQLQSEGAIVKGVPIQGTPVVRRGLIHPNGNVTFMLTQEGVTPYGGYVGEIDKNGELKWIYTDKLSHHDMDVGPDGKVYTITHDFKYQPTPELGLSSDPVPILEDYVTVLSPEGEEIKSISIYDLLKKYPGNITSNFDAKRLLEDKLKLGNGGGSVWFDPTHTNTIMFVDQSLADKVEGIEPGNVLVNLRELNIVVAIDLDKEEISWFTPGPWLYAHEATLLENGNIMIFDNLGIAPYARVLEYNPKSKEIVWKFEGSEKEPFASETVGMQQALKNGNVLIAESYGSRILEVDREGEVVWEYKSPQVVLDSDGKDVTLIPFANRYSLEDLQFLKNSETSK